MDAGMVGLGRMDANTAERLVRGGHRVVGCDLSVEAVARVVGLGAVMRGRVGAHPVKPAGTT
jgi:6-phosphogluconate dehydrogenase